MMRHNLHLLNSTTPRSSDLPAIPQTINFSRIISILILFSVFMLQLLSLAHAEDADFFKDFMSQVSKETDEFVNGATAAPKTLLGTFSPTQCVPQGANKLNPNQIDNAYQIIQLWFTPSVFVVFAVLSGIGIIYMFGQLMNLPNLIAISKDELYQCGITVVRIAFLLAAILTGQMWYSLNIQGGTDPIYNNPSNVLMIDSAMAFARLMVGDMITNYSVLILYNTVIHTIYSATMWFGVTWRAMYSFNLGPVLKPLIDIVGTALQFISLGISEWMLHIVTLCLIKKWVWVFFIPIAILLRSFPYTRNAGEALIALAFSLAVIYPFMFIFDYEVHKLMKNNIVDPENTLSTFLYKSGLLSVGASVVVIMFLMSGVFVPFFLGGALTVGFELIRASVYYISIISIFLPFLNIFITLTAAKETAAFFRVDVNFMSFLKII